MSQNKKAVIIFSIIFALIVVIGVFLGLKDYLWKNPEGTVGNTAGNLNNGGYFCQKDDKVYFANAYDGGALYVMNVDETDIKKLSNAKATNLNVDERYVYYYLNDVQAPSGMGGFQVQVKGIYRASHTGKTPTCIEKNMCGVVSLVDNTLYYQLYQKDGSWELYAMNIHSNNTEPIIDFPANPASVYNGRLYYNNTEGNHNLYTYDTATGNKALLYDGNVWYPDAQGDFVYFMNIGDNHKLCRYQVSTGEVTTLTEDKVDAFLVTGNYIFYQKKSQTEPALMVMYTDGSDPRIIMEGNFSKFGATTKYFYFTDFTADVPMYKVSLETGSMAVETFDAAREAAEEAAK